MGPRDPGWKWTRPRPLGAGSRVGFLLALSLLTGCATLLHVPAADLSAPGWTVWTGQALWKRGPQQAALAGELILGRQADGDVVVSFSKPPVPIFTARTAGDVWRIDLVQGGHAYAGCGRPPRRFVWFWLPEIIGGGRPPGRWRVAHPARDTWLLTNPRTGESIRVVLDS